MAFTRMIVLSENPEVPEQKSSTGYIMIKDHYGQSFEIFKELVAEARKFFPHLKDKNIGCHLVIKSNWCLDHSIISFDLPPNTTHPEFGIYENRLPDIQVS